MDDYRPNSHTYKESQKEAQSEKRVEKVVKGKTKTKKKNELSKLGDVFISEDAANVKSYILMDVLVPAVKKAISDIVRDGIDMILYGETGRSKKSSSSSHYISYSSMSKDPRDRDRSDRPRTGLDYDDIYFEYRPDAEMVLDQMYEIIERYGFVTVADLFDMADRTAPYTAQKYGWTSIRSAEVVRTRDGYKIKLPRATVI